MACPFRLWDTVRTHGCSDDRNRLADYLLHIEQAVRDACSFIEGLTKREGAVLVDQAVPEVEDVLHSVSLPLFFRFL